MATLVTRNVTPLLRELMAAFRVVTVTGPRQSGKTTLAKTMVRQSEHLGTFFSLDDDALLRAAIEDPVGFVQARPGPTVIDEVQRGGDALVRAIKREVDDQPRPGRFLLTGSADFLTVPQLSESLAGRTVLLELWPFSQGEIEGTAERFIDRAIADPESLRSMAPASVSRPAYVDRLCRGGYPEVQSLSERQRDRWFESYIRMVIERDITGLGNIRRGGEVPRLLRLLAARSGSELVMQDVIRDVGLSRQTVYDYVALLRTVYLVLEVPAWSTNLTSRVKRHPKLFLSDSGLASHLLATTAGALERPGAPGLGGLVETFVVNELVRQRTWADAATRLYHFRDRRGAEVDLILESRDGRVVGLEIKASSTVRRSSFDGLAFLRDLLGEDFLHGFVLYLGDQPLPFGDRLTALPIAGLWQAA